MKNLGWAIVYRGIQGLLLTYAVFIIMAYLLHFNF